jgi:imidazolonepropionase-like amidohydrolase
MPAVEALKAMTLNPAEAFGFEDRFGSIEKGKEAELVVWDGHPLELLRRADRVIIAGKEISMVSRSTRLRDRYRQQGRLYPPAYNK